jgi:two-component system phosphate regulon sensor histidine kinase PhoR
LLKSLFVKRLFLPYLVLVSLLIAGTCIVAAARLRNAHVAHREHTLRDESRLLWRLLRAEIDAGRTAQLPEYLRRLGAETEHRATLITPDGQVLADSWAETQRMDSHAGRPEIAAALSSGEGLSRRHSDTIGRDMLYLARRVDDASGRPYILRLAVPLERLQREMAVIYWASAGAALLAIPLAALVIYAFARRTAAPIDRITDVAVAISRGDLDQRANISDTGEIATLGSAINSAADSIKGQVLQAGQQADQLLSIISAMGEGIVATDAQQKIVYVNPAAGALLGFDHAGALGKPLWQLLRFERIIRAASDVLESGGREHFELGAVSGRYIEISLTRYPPHGAPHGLLLVAHDTTQSVRYQELRKEFVANVSHELRTPLTVIKGFVETLRDGALHDPAIAPDYLAKIERHTNQLTNLVNDLLELSRLESQPDLPRRVTVDLAAVARKTVDLLLPAAQARHQALDLNVPAHLPLVLGNPDYLERAIANLIDNAIKYTPEGGRIHVSATANGAGVTLEVTDNGIGIPPDDIPRIFERFYRVDRSRSREMGGTGLGLSIVKHIVQAHGGSLDVLSTPGQGSTFRFRLPTPHAE